MKRRSQWDNYKDKAIQRENQAGTRPDTQIVESKISRLPDAIKKNIMSLKQYIKDIKESAGLFIIYFRDGVKKAFDSSGRQMMVPMSAKMNISVREAQMDVQEHKELLGTSQVYIHSSTYLNDIRRAVDLVNKMEPEAIKRISDIIEDNTIGYNTLGQYLHPVMNSPTPDELKNVSAVIKLNMEAIKKAPESQSPDGFINKIADVIIHESEHKHDVETTGTSNESHPEAKEQEFMRRLEQTQPMQSISSRDVFTKKAYASGPYYDGKYFYIEDSLVDDSGYENYDGHVFIDEGTPYTEPEQRGGLYQEHIPASIIFENMTPIYDKSLVVKYKSGSFDSPPYPKGAVEDVKSGLAVVVEGQEKNDVIDYFVEKYQDYIEQKMIKKYTDQ